MKALKKETKTKLVNLKIPDNVYAIAAEIYLLAKNGVCSLSQAKQMVIEIWEMGKLENTKENIRLEKLAEKSRIPMMTFKKQDRDD